MSIKHNINPDGILAESDKKPTNSDAGLKPELLGRLVIISGPSGVGKGTVVAALKLHFPDFVYPVSHTTRAMRPGEKDGEVYHFIPVERFRDGIKNGEFLEWAQVHHSSYYGTLKRPIIDALKAGKTVVREVDIQGFHSIKAVIPKANLVTIFLKAESSDKLLQRIKNRSHLPEDELRRRMESAEKELGEAAYFDYQVWNLEGKLENCVGAIEKIVLARTARS